MALGLLFLVGIPAASHAQERERKIADLRDRVAPVRSIAQSDEDFSDLAPIAAAIGDARIVQLGEGTHGDGAAFAAKVRLVKFLHQHLGFDVLLWESGTFNVRVVDDSLRAGADPAASARLGIFLNWSESAEVLPLFEYARASYAGDRPLEMAGFDMQFAGREPGLDVSDLEHGLLRFIAEMIDPAVQDTATRLASGAIDAFRRLYAMGVARSAFVKELRDAGVTDALADSMRAWRLTRQASFAPTALDLELFLAAADGLQQILQSRPSALAGLDAQRELAFMQRVVGNLRVYGLNWYAYGVGGLGGDNPEYNATEIRRDARMADNIRWFAESRYRDRKLIVWAHNGHILNASVRPDWSGLAPTHTEGALMRMGTYVAERFGQGVYTIGFTAFTGEYGSVRARNPSPIRTMPSDGIEALLHELGHSHAFLDLRRLPADHWLRRPVTMVIWNHTPEVVEDLPQVFDGIFFIDRMARARPISAH